VAEHRLQLALNAKDLGEIERSLQQVRVFEQLGTTEGVAHANSGSMARGDRSKQPPSARLMEAAGSVMRQLNEAATRRQAATTALQVNIADGTEPMALPTNSASRDGSQGSRDWMREAMDVLHEAKHSSVAPTLIEHAKLKIREKRRERRDENEALEALQTSLSKKDATTQEVLRNMRRVQRLQSAR